LKIHFRLNQNVRQRVKIRLVLSLNDALNYTIRPRFEAEWGIRILLIHVV